MYKTLVILLFAITGIIIWSMVTPTNHTNQNITKHDNKIDSLKSKDKPMDDKITKTDEQWKNELTPEQYRILRLKGTERAFTGEYWDHHELGTYVCAGCGTELFESDTKFESGCGWPSYFQPIDSSRIIYKEDRSFGMIRTEVMCAKCEGHLGHVFDDGPPPTGLRYCINSGSMKFISKTK